MDERELRGLLLQRLHMELLIFKDSILQKGKEDIFKDSYEIEVFVNLYEILAVHTDNLQCDTIRGLLNLNFGILKSIYQEWLTKEDSFFDELRAYACNELENILEMGHPECGKDDKDGKELNKAA